MASITWTELTPYQQAALKSGVNAGKVSPRETWQGNGIAFQQMTNYGLLEKRDGWYYPTPAGHELYRNSKQGHEMVNWTELTDNQRAYLNRLALRGDQWTHIDKIQISHNLNGHVQLIENGYIETDYSDGRNFHRITPAGVNVWLSGQQTAAPRTVWVAMWHEQWEGDDIVGLRETEVSAKALCQECSHTQLEWSEDMQGVYHAKHSAPTSRGEFTVFEKPVLP